VPVKSVKRHRGSRDTHGTHTGHAGAQRHLPVGLDGCVDCGPCAFVRPRVLVSRVSRECPGSPRCLFGDGHVSFAARPADDEGPK
jgi:NAD-dependent dihydropyrimidine dehydrogenase PreA subunit